MSEPLPVVEMSDISIEFPGVKALDRVDFHLFEGEVHALMGENGAGKSTLIKALTGVYKIDAGSIAVAGQQRRFHGTDDAQRAGISTVYQEINLVTNLSVGENVMLGHEVRRLGVNWRATHRAARAALARLGLDHLDTHRQLSTLPIAMQQLVAISRAMAIEAKVLILDEPTSSLATNEVEQLFGVMRALRDEGVAILFVSHFLDQIYAVSDRVTILRNGRYEGEYLTAELDRSVLISKMIGKDLDTLASLGDNRRIDERDYGAEEPVLSVTGLSRRGSIDPTDVDIHRGEVVGLAGLLGSGRTELARLLYGADRRDEGEVRLRGERVDIKSPAEGLGKGIAFSTENRRDEGVIADLTVRENIILALQAERGWARPIPRREQDEIVSHYIKALNVRPADANRLIKNLSGGNQQKVLLGRWLATKPDLLILDEPTRGIDVGAKAEIQEVVAQLAEDGVSVVFISSELAEVVRVSERIIILKDRQKIGEMVHGPDVTAQAVVDVIAAHGVETAIHTLAEDDSDRRAWAEEGRS